MNKSIGVIIPEGCKQIYVFKNEDDFMEEVNSGRMKSLYGINDKEKSFFPLFIAYKILK